MAIETVFHAKTQQHEDVVWSVDANNEILCTFSDGHVLKFPGDLEQDELVELVAQHEEQNKGQEVITPEMEAEQAAIRAKNEALIAQLNGAKK